MTIAPGDVRIARALLSVSDKRGLVEFARGLQALGVEIVSTGGTAQALAAAGVATRPIAELTGSPEILDGRVKTLHPKLYASLLALRDDPEHMATAEAQGVEWIDLVCVNLYPFQATAARRGVPEAEVIENIDIGGPTMIRAAAKNAAFVAPVVRPESYDAILAELRDGERRLSLSTRESLAAEAFAYTARYDTAIASWFSEKRDDLPQFYLRAYEKVVDLPYGENPHQRAAYYAQAGGRMHLLSMVSQRGGKQLSANNLLDLDAARLLVREFQLPACVIVKHNNPCGCAVGESALEAWEKAFACDPQSAYGGIICLNRPVDAALAERLVEHFVEVLFAPGYSEEALELLGTKPKLRILEDHERRTLNIGEAQLKQVAGGLIVQDRDTGIEQWEEMRVVTETRPTDAQRGDLLFAWRVCKHVRSNAIVIARELATVGIGAGQMSRVDAVRLAVEKGRSELLRGAALASDAFFPFADSAQLAIEAGISAVIQPGGSIRDDEVVEAFQAAGVAMVFTDRRHFRH